MDSLLKLAIEAHGGLNAWSELRNPHANISIGRALWDLKQLPVHSRSRVELKLHSQHVATHLLDVDERFVITPNQIFLQPEAGTTSTRASTRGRPLPGQSADSKWDKLHASYFSSYAP